jgi:predicted transport protein
MPIFQIVGTQLKKLKVLQLDKEKTLQQLVEANLSEVLDLAFLASEYTTTFGGRIDTLAVDASGAPVIIEYKRNKNDNVINQSLSYLKWLKSQKPGFFEKLIQDKLGADAAKKITLDWNNPRVICIAESFSKFDIDTAEVVPLRIELMRYRYYDNSIFSLEPVAVGESGSASAEIQTKDAPKQQAEDKPASVNALLAKASAETKELFGQFRERIMALDDTVEEKPNSLYVAYRRSKNFAEVHINRGGLKIHLRPIDYLDPKKMVEKIPEGYNWTLDRRVYLKHPSDLDEVLSLIEQSYKDVL